ncbi:MAG: hypothetical protein IKW22_00690 [Bacteroidaceae bacterium]|nr:hypothetical protein [Bacteroidaceae bacterium]
MKRVFGIRRFVVGFATTAGAVLALAFRMVLLWIHARQQRSFCGVSITPV